MTILLTYLPFLIALMVILAFVQIELKRMEKKIDEIDKSNIKVRELYRDEFVDYRGYNGASLVQLSENIKAAKSQAYEEFMCNSGGIAELTGKIVAIEQALSNHDAPHRDITDRLIRLEKQLNEKLMKNLAKAMKGRKNGK